MPRIDDASLMLRALHAAVVDHEHWVFLSDTSAGHELMGRLVTSLILLEGTDPTYGDFCFACPSGSWQLDLSVVIVSKRFLSVAQVNRLLKLAREGSPEANGSQDIITLMSEATPPERVRVVLRSAAAIVQASDN
jgi:hypothetical protein